MQKFTNGSRKKSLKLQGVMSRTALSSHHIPQRVFRDRCDNTSKDLQLVKYSRHISKHPPIEIVPSIFSYHGTNPHPAFYFTPFQGNVSVSSLRKLYEKLEKFKLSKVEKLMIANIRPDAYAHLTPLIVDAYSRYDENQLYVRSIYAETNYAVPLKMLYEC